MAKLRLHRLALPDDALGYFLRRDWPRREEPADLGIADHRQPRAGIAGLEGADDQACCLKPCTRVTCVNLPICPATAAIATINLGMQNGQICVPSVQTKEPRLPLLPMSEHALDYRPRSCRSGGVCG